MSLPAGFTEGLWDGWEAGELSGIVRSLDRPQSHVDAVHPFHAVQVFMIDGIYSWVSSLGSYCSRDRQLSESQCLAEVNAFAEKHGGWKDSRAVTIDTETNQKPGNDPEREGER